MNAQHGNDRNDLPARLAKPARNTLAVAGITRLAQRTEREIAALHGMGPKALGQLRDALAGRGLAFASETRAS